MPSVPDDAVQPAAEVMLRQYESQYNADHLTWRDFAGDARAVLEAAAPAMAEAVAGKITAHMESFGPRKPAGALEPVTDTGRQYRTWRRHFGIAARVAAGAFSTREDKLRAAAKALSEGNYIACNTEGGADDGTD